MSKKMRSNLLLLLTAFIWGSAFIAQKSGMDYIQPFTYNGIRMFIGGLVLIPVILILNRGKKDEFDEDPEVRGAQNRMAIIGGLCCGIALFVASSLQQFGISYTTAGKAAFITTLYVMMVPIIGLFLGKKVKPIMWLCVVMGVVGLYLLCMTDASFRMEFGDTLVLLCAVAFSGHILVIDYFSPKADGIKISCIQFLTVGVLGMICMLIFETPNMQAIIDCAVPILYAGVLSCGVAYTLQVVAQKDADPTAASLILSLESVFGMLGGVVILHEELTMRALLGCVIIFAAVVIAQLPSKAEREAAKLAAAEKED